MSSPTESFIHQVKLTPLRQIMDERGGVLHWFRSDSPLFKGFGEVYFSEVNPGVVKAWKKHHLTTQHFASPVGRIRLVLFDDRPESPSRGQVEELTLGRPDFYNLVQIPPQIWYGFMGLGDRPSLLANLIDRPYDPTEAENLDPAQGLIPYLWPEMDLKS